jgi:hypothetical protein
MDPLETIQHLALGFLQAGGLAALAGQLAVALRALEVPEECMLEELEALGARLQPLALAIRLRQEVPVEAVVEE